MKRIVMMMCSAIVALLFATGIHAQNRTSTLTRSEQFILDSMRMELDKAAIETKYDMYCDSLQQELDNKSIASNTTEEVVQLMVPISFFLFVILIVWICCHISYRKQRDRYRIIEKAIENGQEIPEGLFDEPKKGRKQWTATLRQAIVFIAIGIGLAIFGETIGVEEITSIATIPGIIGLGYLVVTFIERREQLRIEGHENSTKDTPDESRTTSAAINDEE
ncbi:MAG: hypothetical protein IKY75_08505 [Bacteroidaceae bacterium]|nr:hypothetical protein [Bacteroidaceae bacterium]